MADSKEVKKAQVQFRKRSRVILKDKEGKIQKIIRGRDGMEIFVGQSTGTGKILAIERDNAYTGGMKAETEWDGKRGVWTAIPCISLDYETEKKDSK